MDTSEARLDRIESQRLTDTSHDQSRRRYFPMNLINKGAHTLSSRGFLQSRRGDGTTPPTEDTESVPEFFINLKLSDLSDPPAGEYVPMNAEMFSELNDGNREWLEKLKSHGTPLARLKSEGGDSILHLAAVWGHLELVKSIVSECPCLLSRPNSKDQLPLHVVARAGHSAVVEALVSTVTFVSAKHSEEERDIVNPYVVKDRDGDTPLHLALKGRYMEIASSLVNANRQASFIANKVGISPLYLAVEVGDVSLVKAMLNITGNNDTEGRTFILDSVLEGRKYLAHAALKLRSTDILDVILKESPSLVDERDEEGRTCVLFGASMGYYEGVCNLLDRSTKYVYESNNDGSFPIHMAVEKGHIEVVKEILKRCPYSKHMLNKKGQNILHIAASSGKYEILRHLMKHEQSNHLANEQDVDGNTPLHLATKKWRPRAARCLMGLDNLFIQNNKGLTALDIAELNVQSHYIFRERLTLMVLVHGHVRSDRRLMKTMKLTRPSVPVDCHGNKEYINALTVVAALVATVTFAAGFTIPGGYKSSAPHLGMANLATDHRLILFLILDTLAMQSSVVAVVSLIWAQLGDPALLRSSLNVALPSLSIALISMVFAFICGIDVSVGNVLVLIVTISLISCILFIVMLLVLVPHVSLQRPSVHAVYGVHFLTFLKLVNDDEDESYQTSTHRSMKRAKSLEISGSDNVAMPVTT